MLILAIETSTSACSAAVADEKRILGEFILDTDRTLSGRILAGIDGIMKDTGCIIDDLDGIAVSLGPGSFTGLRVGVATAKGLALATGKPVVGYSSLASLALNLPWSEFPICAMLDARKHEVYAGVYRCNAIPEAIVADCVASASYFLETVTEKTIFIGTGVVRYREIIMAKLGENAVFAPFPCDQPRASNGAVIAQEELLNGRAIPLSLLNPTYIRPSEAELNKMASKDR
jgi:tRNA threonylcarbamoyladenosine biosynthesis protein TsaB